MSFLSEPIQNILIQPKRQIDSISIDVTISENSNDSLEITKQPLQIGAMASDHAFKKPNTLAMQASWRSNTLGVSLADIYQRLLNLQNKLAPFTIITPKRVYKDMMFSSMSVLTDKNTENVLMVSMQFENIIMVPVSPTSVDRAALANPGSNGGTQPAGQKNSVLNNLLGDKVGASPL